MSRIFKNSKIKYHPPKVQLQHRDALTGSVPTRPRTASDNRTGVYRTFFDDLNTITWGSHDAIFKNVIQLYYKLDYLSGTFTNPTVGPEPLVMSGSAVISPAGSTFYNNQGLNPGCLHVSSALSGVAIALTSSLSSFSFVDGTNDVPFSIGVWINLDSSTRFQPIVFKGSLSTATFEYGFAINTDVLEFALADSGSFTLSRTSITTIPSQSWVHVAATYDGSKTIAGIKLYINGTYQTASTDTSSGLYTGMWSVASSNLKFMVGAWPGLPVYSDGNFDEAVLFSKELLPTEVLSLCNARFPYNSLGQLSLGSGLESTSQFLLGSDEFATTLFAPGVQRAGVADNTLLDMTSMVRHGQDIQPFRDDHNYAADGKLAVSGVITQDPFWATGSALTLVGEGFDQPVWSKTKIEIDLTPTLVHSVSIENNTGNSNNFPMIYWNNDLKKYQGIGPGTEWVKYASGSQSNLQRMLEDQCIGFGQSFTEILSSPPNIPLNQTYGQSVSNFGFPYHPKFHATSSNLIPLSGVLTAPFLVEKIVLEYSGAFGVGTSHKNKNINDLTVLNFFVLNQRRPFSINIPDIQTINFNSGTIQSFTTGVMIPGSNPSTATIRDIVTTLKVGAFLSSSVTTGNPAADRAYTELQADLKILLPGSLPLNFNGRFVVSGTVRNQLPTNGLHTIYNGPSSSSVGSSFLLLQQENSTRSGLRTAGGRSFLGDLSESQILQTITQNGFTFDVLLNYFKVNPYILMPSDNLVVGWQIPYDRIMSYDTVFNPIAIGQSTFLQFAQAPSRLVLYGSLIRNNEEVHDTLNQLLGSRGIHEVIG